MSLDAFIDKFGGWTEEYKFYNDEVVLRYDVKNHLYLLLKPDGNLEPQDGVTTICHIIDKSDALVPWACKMMANRLITEGVLTLPSGEKIVRQMSYQDYEILVLGAKTAHKDKLEDAGEVGHVAHAWIERYIKSLLREIEDSEQECLDSKPTEPRALNCCNAALDWMKAHNVRWLGTERKIYSRKYKYAGTLDGLCIVDSCNNPRCCKRTFKDRLTVSDWKTSNYLYPEYLLQTAAYLQAYNEENGYATNYKAEMVTDRWVNRLGKEDGEFESWHAGAEDFRADFEAFRLALMLKREYTDIKARVRRRELETRESVKAERRAAKEAEELAEKARKAEEKARLKVEREESLRLTCKNATKYKGTRKPTCNGGLGCLTCSAKYAEVQAVKRCPASLQGKTVKPLPGANFSGIVWVPKQFFTEGKTEKDALLAYLDDDSLTDRGLVDILKPRPITNPARLLGTGGPATEIIKVGPPFTIGHYASWMLVSNENHEAVMVPADDILDAMLDERQVKLGSPEMQKMIDNLSNQ